MMCRHTRHLGEQLEQWEASPAAPKEQWGLDALMLMVVNRPVTIQLWVQPPALDCFVEGLGVILSLHIPWVVYPSFIHTIYVFVFHN